MNTLYEDILCNIMQFIKDADAASAWSCVARRYIFLRNKFIEFNNIIVVPDYTFISEHQLRSNVIHGTITYIDTNIRGIYSSNIFRICVLKYGKMTEMVHASA